MKLYLGKAEYFIYLNKAKYLVKLYLNKAEYFIYLNKAKYFISDDEKK